MEKQDTAHNGGVEDEAASFNGISETETNEGETSQCCGGRLQGMSFILVSVVVVSIAITVALVISIVLGNPQVASHGAIVSDNRICSHFGLTVLKKSNNAVDGAVATAMCLTVLRPDFASLGGCGLALVRDRNAQETNLYDFICSAPVSRQVPVSVNNPSALVGVPGLVSGLFSIHSAFGNVSWSEVMSPAVEVANSGFLPDASLVRIAHEAQKKLKTNQRSTLLDAIVTTASSPGEFYYPSNGLIKLLRQLQKDGAPFFYKSMLGSKAVPAGESFAGKLKTLLNANGMQWTDYDMSSYKTVTPKALQTSLSGFVLDTFPAPVGGGVFLLSLLGSLDLKDASKPFNHEALEKNNASETAALLHSLLELAVLSETGSAGLGDINDSDLGDAVSKAQTKLLSATDRKANIAKVKDASILPVEPNAPHFVTTDIGNGAVVATDSNGLTVVLNLFMGSPFGSLVEMPDSGVVLNSALGLFTGAGLNKPGPGRRPIVPLAPVYMATARRRCGIRLGIAASDGSSGTSGLLDIAQTIVNAALFLRNTNCKTDIPRFPVSQAKATQKTQFGSYRSTPAATNGCMKMQTATDLARIHLSSPKQESNGWLRQVMVEANFPNEISNGLALRGHRIVKQAVDDIWLSRVAALGWDGYNMMTSVDSRGPPPSLSIETF